METAYNHGGDQGLCRGGSGHKGHKPTENVTCLVPLLPEQHTQIFRQSFGDCIQVLSYKDEEMEGERWLDGQCILSISKACAKVCLCHQIHV